MFRGLLLANLCSSFAQCFRAWVLVQIVHDFKHEFKLNSIYSLLPFKLAALVGKISKTDEFTKELLVFCFSETIGFADFPTRF